MYERRGFERLPCCARAGLLLEVSTPSYEFLNDTLYETTICGHLSEAGEIISGVLGLRYARRRIGRRQDLSGGFTLNIVRSQGFTLNHNS